MKKRDCHEVSANVCGWALHSFSKNIVMFMYKLPEHKYFKLQIETCPRAEVCPNHSDVVQSG